MKKLAHNDILEVLKLDDGVSPNPRYVQNNLKEMDPRCRWALSMIQAWGAMAVLGDVVKDSSTKPMPPSDLVMRICEVVDAAWNEMEHRGWILNVNDSLGE